MHTWLSRTIVAALAATLTLPAATAHPAEPARSRSPEPAPARAVARVPDRPRTHVRSHGQRGAE